MHIDYTQLARMIACVAVLVGGSVGLIVLVIMFGNTVRNRKPDHRPARPDPVQKIPGPSAHHPMPVYPMTDPLEINMHWHENARRQNSE